VKGHLNSLNKDSQDKDKLMREISDNIKSFDVKLRLWEHKLRNFVQILQLKIP